MKTDFYRLVSVIGYDDLEFIIKESQMSYDEGNDLITGTKCICTYSAIEDYLYNYPLKKGTLLVHINNICLTRDDVLERLESLTHEDVLEHKRKIKEAKQVQQLIKSEVTKKKINKIRNEKHEEYKLKSLIRKARHM